MEDDAIKRTLAPTLADIEKAKERVYTAAIRTPLVRLHTDEGPEIWLKLENLQPIGSFKIRGSANAIGQLAPAELERVIWTASAGNMAQGVAWNARQLGKAEVSEHLVFLHCQTLNLHTQQETIEKNIRAAYRML